MCLSKMRCNYFLPIGQIYEHNNWGENIVEIFPKPSFNIKKKTKIKLKMIWLSKKRRLDKIHVSNFLKYYAKIYPYDIIYKLFGILESFFLHYIYSKYYVL